MSVLAADNALVAAGYYLSMLTEPRSPADRVILLENVLTAIRRAENELREGDK